MSVANEIEEQAAALLARQDAEPENPAVRAELESWLSGDPRREVAYLRLRAAWRQLNRIAALGSYENAQREISGTQQATTTRNWPRWGAAAAVVLVAIALTVWWQAGRVKPRVIAFSTPVGGYMRETLSDGSTLELNTQTDIEVVFDSSVRGIRLLQGEARFHVAKDPQRPFVVTVATDRVRAVGTDFSVRTRAQQTDVYVAEGIVSLEDSVHRGNDAGARVRAGQGAVMTSTGVHISNLPPGAVAARLAWDRGLLIFAGEPLSSVAEELNRYNTVQIRVTDSTVAALKIDGTFAATNAVGFVRLLEQGFPVSVTRQGDTVLVASRRN
ncbi:MAG: FecR domain-containing protein [Proteobacteria bacterium]|nr:FecR domain-containing protein [Pseudomonadota bacterium]